MTQITWNQLGPREKQILAVLRRADAPLTTREVLTQLQQDGEQLAYTTVSTIVTRLVEKEFVTRTEEVHAGSPRYRHTFQPAPNREELVETIVEDVAGVLGNPGLDLLARRAAERERDGEPQLPHLNEHTHDS
ncbi:BlaI/MecI/CopY family transcriptional regulator [Halobium palmae]|uniref:BlaI/MecI/CopY family transcriptional regulator n=1 Tax=Halobium palmae TaxID=1776492 RepID=A0ABD5RVW6_9EURY